MKITKLKLYTVPPRWLFLKIETDSELFGWGEPIVEGRSGTTQAAVNELSHYLIGKDPLRIEDIWQSLYRSGFYRGGPVLMSAISGIDQALWDIKGKFFGAPVYDLLGGACHDRVKVYRGIGGSNVQELVAAAQEAVSQGYDTVKATPTDEMHFVDSYKKIDEACARVAALREKFGMSVDIALDFHGRVHKPMAKVLAKELEQFKLLFIEEPVQPQNNEALREVACATSTPIATGERMFSRWDYKPLFESGYADIVQPDLSHAGGISECKKIASMAEGYDMAVAPHCPLGPIALAACIQLDACTPNAFIQEQAINLYLSGEGSALAAYLKDPDVFCYKDGFAQLPTAPGLGIEIDEEKVLRASKDPHNWKNPVWRTYDGAIAEW